ncbi:MAG: hypothetical protein GFH27_549281n16 [Chloroflexi bacterium AL-W]|nr:hypothetical protein [Chloroflexi bacterium AL-N1]NOK65902.1 hypothetical protein [Chloroflexi bacterium AL-N10]NOK72783.1 hypothetical protein [Chloroflexi bacterium AL-N5]NOK79680.1 hypothetical protein [Chloroflexi bacterium AL-W]NOK93005.1 hypothetical protein [Chloroflexi bacterium AL-N15]
MAQSNVEQIIGRAVTDEDFRQELINNPREACKEYDLTEDELDSLEKLDTQSLQAFAISLDKRITKKGGTGFV